ncbi:MAG: folylpolyglutamate synthase/dihydrofolate synthase family protein [Pseudomonadota bacterium]
MAPDAANAALKDWLQRLESRHDVPIDLDLSRCGTVYRRMGAPRPAQRVITVAGTNGKGSTVAWLSALLGLKGKRYAAYTSPHLLRFNERLRFQGREVDSAELVSAFEAVEGERDDISLTYFEHTTLACLWLMSRAELDTAVLEVGLGGRLDTVNLVDTDLAIITPIGLDHQAFLGEDRQTIGREKAGILRPDRPLVAVERQPPMSVLERARELNCPVLLRERDYTLDNAKPGRLRFRLGEKTVRLVSPDLGGAHQRENLAAALAAICTLYPDDEDVVDLGEGLASTAVPGRLQRFGPEPGYWVDVGHNPMAAAVVQQALAGAEQRYLCVLGMLADKDAESVARLLAPGAVAFLCAGLQDGWRAQSGHALAERIRGAVGSLPVLAFPTVRGALKEARQRSMTGSPVLVFGSFHTAQQALSWLEEQGQAMPAGASGDASSASPSVPGPSFV